MTKRYTDDDVTRLAQYAQLVIEEQEAWNSESMGLYHIVGDGRKIQWHGLDKLRHALTPFLPDPEDVLIEKMADAYIGGREIFDSRSVREHMRAALAVVKQEGLPE